MFHKLNCFVLRKKGKHLLSSEVYLIIFIASNSVKVNSNTKVTKMKVKWAKMRYQQHSTANRNASEVE
jgi:hypothetical protein